MFCFLDNFKQCIPLISRIVECIFLKKNIDSEHFDYCFFQYKLYFNTNYTFIPLARKTDEMCVQTHN